METKETGRVEAFSDGVFAIAITLLVLDLKVPTQPPLLQGLLAEWPVYAAYLISFTFILIMWVNHHWMFQHIVRVDSTFMLLNGLLLLGITVLPFPTSIVAQYVLTPEQVTAAAIYNGWAIVIGVFFNLVWRYAANNGRLLSRKDYDAGMAQVITDRYKWGLPMYFLAFVLSFVWAPASLALNFLMALFFALPQEFQTPWRRRRPAPAPPGLNILDWRAPKPELPA